MFKIIRLTREESQGDTGNEKFDAFVAQVNKLEQEAVDADLLVDATINLNDHGDAIGVIRYMKLDPMKGGVRPAFEKEVEAALRRAKRGMGLVQ